MVKPSSFVHVTFNIRCWLFLKQHRIIKKNWLPPGIEPRNAYIAHKRSATELQQPPSEQALQFCVYTVKRYAILQSHSQQTNKISFFFEFIIRWVFFLIYKKKIQRMIRIFENREIWLVCWEWDCSIAVPFNSINTELECLFARWLS